MDYRPVPDEETFARYVRYAFVPERGPDVSDWLEDEDRPAPPRIRRGLFPEDGDDVAGDDPVTVCSSYDFTVRLRGASLSMGGVSTVATPPQHRRRGYVGDLMRELCREYREDGTTLAALWPFKHPFYAQFGWATCNHYLSWGCPPEALRGAASDRVGAFREVEPAEWESLDAVHRAATAPNELSVDRTEEWWRERVFKSWDTDPYVYVFEREGSEARSAERDAPGRATGRDARAGGENRAASDASAGDARAYLSYAVRDGEEGRRLAVYDHAAVDDDAFGHLLRFLADHESQVERVSFDTVVDASLLDRVDDPRKLDCEHKAGPMVRLVDVPGALEQLSYPTDGRVVVALTDPLLPELAGRYRLDVTDGAATCEETDEMPDAVLGVGAFSQLVVGHRSAADLLAAGELEAGTDAIDRLDALFPPAKPYLGEGF